MKAYSQDLRARAIKLFDDGYERKHIKSILSISYDTLNDWIRRYKRTGDYSSRQHLNKGFTRKFTDKEAVLTYLAEHPNALALEIRDAVAPDIPLSTFRDALVWMEITYKKREFIYTKR